MSSRRSSRSNKNSIIEGEQPNKKAPRVAIIGAGVAGCAMAGALRDYCLDDFVVLEANDRPGGLWTNTYPGAQGTYYGVINF